MLLFPASIAGRFAGRDALQCSELAKKCGVVVSSLACASRGMSRAVGGLSSFYDMEWDRTGTNMSSRCIATVRRGLTSSLAFT